MADILQVEGVNAKGFGIIPKLVMQDKRLTATAKAIYAYFCSYAGAGKTAFPSRAKIVADLGINKDTYHKHFDLLKSCGYIGAEQEQDPSGKFKRNVFTLFENVPCPKFSDTAPCPNLPYPKNSDTAIYIKNNRVKSNSSSSSPTATPIHQFWQDNGFGKLPAKVKAEMDEYLAKGFTPGLMLAVLGECVDYSAPNWAYARRILSRLEAEGTTTAEAYNASKRPYSPSGARQRPRRAQPDPLQDHVFKPFNVTAAADDSNTGSGPEQDADNGNPTSQGDCTTSARPVQQEQEV